ncbi:MAG: UDP-N-acetylmuramoyl-L-alanyl-D-glutamate--2,6-diaminopimelate ligase [Saprospiraceae bacterium]|nr:UDP-N-acetylmuramoyl-L-alanyl-D-glutamate--2,6-diaminopimelate ligase [Saprospiraceae bacterium]
MLLQAIIQNLSLKEAKGNLDREISRIDFDSRQVIENGAFVAVRGTHVDGHAFIEKAVGQGAVAVIAEELPAVLNPEVTYIQVSDSASALAHMAANWYGFPSRRLRLVGITGTNGKTTTATLLFELFRSLGYKAGLLSTIENKIGDTVLPATHTTPDALSINSLLADMADAGCDFAFMEVSSHAADQRRIDALDFAGAIFTNITHDHLDYHKTFQAYITAKKRFFDILPRTAFALINIDDKRGEVMVQNTAARVYRYSLHAMADFRARVLDNGIGGLHLSMNGQQVHARLIGEFNAYNLLAVYAAATLLGQDSTETLVALSQLRAAEGRFDYLIDPGTNISAIVDYAHTPDALEKVLDTISRLRKGKARIITVVGCGGDRDRAKRPEMAKVACQLSDQVILTSDNPRTEPPEQILADMQAGIPADAGRKTLTLVDRRTAIQTACRMAVNGDIILVAGKGHEKYQEINGVKYPFDDKEILRNELLADPSQPG